MNLLSAVWLAGRALRLRGAAEFQELGNNWNAKLSNHPQLKVVVVIVVLSRTFNRAKSHFEFQRVDSVNAELNKQKKIISINQALKTLLSHYCVQL